MSRVARDWAWALAVPPVQKLVITAPAEPADEAGNCFPSLSHLTVMTALARSTVASTLQQLEAAHRIARVPGGGRRSTYYRLLIGEPDVAPERGRARRASEPPATGRPSRDATAGSRGGAVEAPVVREPDRSSPGGGPQQSDRRTSAVREPDPSSPGDGLVREPVVREPDPSSPTAGLQQSGSRTLTVM